MFGGLLRRHPRIHKTHQVRNAMVPEDQVHLGFFVLKTVDGVKLFRKVRGKMSIAVPGKKDAETSSQNAFIRGHPLHSYLLGHREYFLRNAALRRPNPDRTFSKHLFMQVEPAHELLASILGMAIAVLRQ